MESLNEVNVGVHVWCGIIEKYLYEFPTNNLLNVETIIYCELCYIFISQDIIMSYMYNLECFGTMCSLISCMILV
jgi:hypothetical protein